MAYEIIERDGKRYKVIITPYITVKGVKRYHPKGGYYKFEVEITD